jgi:alpha-D-ribose 1-methylphosphonate 5-triphosphate diphosphatase PhnM
MEEKIVRIHIFNANIITGDGKTLHEGASLNIDEDGLILDVKPVPYTLFNRSEIRINAHGNYVIPGIINHHAHNLTRGPTICNTGDLPYSVGRIKLGLQQHMLEGTTTIVNVDGLCTMEELAEARNLTPMRLQTMTSHLPSYLEGARHLNLGGLKSEHILNAEDQIKKGAVAIGEVGTGEADASQDRLIYIPETTERMTGFHISIDESAILQNYLYYKEADKEGAIAWLSKKGIKQEKSKQLVERLIEIKARTQRAAELSKQGTREAATLAAKMKVPMLMHMTPFTKDEGIEYANELDNLLIAAHTNFRFKPGEAIEAAKQVKKAGGWVDIMSGDVFSARELYKNHVTSMALLEEGLLDLVCTDFTASNWDPILRVLEHFVVNKVTDLPGAIALATSNVAKAIPKAAPNRGEIADDCLYDVRTVIIGGRVVVDDGKPVASPE